MKISEFFILPSSGEELLIRKKYNYDIAANASELFRQQLNGNKNTIPVCMQEDGVLFHHIKRHKLYLVIASKQQVPSVCMVELLTRIYHLLKDFCGTLTEQSLTRNFMLVHEILDEVVDSGFVQLTSTDKLKQYIVSEPAVIHKPTDLAPGIFGVEHRVAASDASARPVIASTHHQEQRKNEVFIDVIEKLTVLVASNGDVIRSEVHGRISMKSFLSNSPRLQIGLNDQVTVSQTRRHKAYGGGVHLDDCILHSGVDAETFERDATLAISPPEGEFSVMTYTQTVELTHGLPFRLYPVVTNDGRDVVLELKLLCEIPTSCHAVNIEVHVPLPKSTVSFSQKLSGVGQSAELLTDREALVWRIKRMPANSQLTATFKLISGQDTMSTSHMKLGPAALSFEICGHVCSGLQIRFLRVIDKDKSYTPIRWIRYITTSDSYIVKLPAPV